MPRFIQCSEGLYIYKKIRNENRFIKYSVTGIELLCFLKLFWADKKELAALLDSASSHLSGSMGLPYRIRVILDYIVSMINKIQ